MKPKIIESLDNWNILKQALINKGYRLWQMQYGYDRPEGFHAWFMKDDKNVEIITHDKAVQEDMVSSNLT